MTILNIYSLDDIQEKNIIASLPEGDHILGRGGILHVTDKRVSRKHAVIKVSNERISLTSIHVNPCFFKAVNGKTLTVIKQNEENELNDGDQFALLPESYWFKVKIKRNDNETYINDNKRLYDTNLGDTIEAKRAKITNNFDVNQASTSTQNDCLDKNTSQEEIMLETNFENENQASTSRITQQTSNDLLAINTSQEEIKLEITNEEEVNSSFNSRETIRIDDLSEGIKQEENITSNNEEENQNLNKNSEEQGEINIENNTSFNVATSNNENPNITRNGTRSRPRRERCWYAERCFRKNPNHRDQFSHPGDEDYASDPDDDRPECPYGLTCYRKNPDHRTEFKHKTRPAPKPSNVNLNVNVLGGCPFCGHCQRKKNGGGTSGKPDYESDVDDY